MRRTTCLLAVAAWLAVAETCVPQTAATSLPAVRNPLLIDIALRDGGVLLGQVVQPEGAPMTHVAVVLRHGGKQLAAGATNRAGYFAFSGLKTGTYQVATPVGTVTCQAWTTGTAPPVAQSAMLIVAGQDVARGQYDARTYAGKLARPLLVGGLVATAVAVPIAISNAHRNSASGE